MKKIAPFFILAVLFCAFATPNDKLAESKARGEEVYSLYCIACHMGQGEGVPGTIPPLANSDYLLQNIDRAIHVVKYGQLGEITVNGTTYNSYMAPLGLSDDEIADVLNYVLNSWGNKHGKLVTEEQVAAVKE